MGRARFVALLLLVTITAPACSGPTRSLDVGIKEVPSDIVLGSPESGAPAPPPVPAVVPVVVGPGLPPGLFAPPGGSAQSSTTLPSKPCPDTDPLMAPKRQATTTISDPPPEGTLPFRVQGVFSVSGPDAREGRFPSESTRTIAQLKPTATGFTYQVAAELAGTTRTTGYQVINRSSVPGELGLYVSFIDTESATGATSRFHPALPMKLVDLPMIANNTVTAAGTDPISATTVSWSTTVKQKQRVAACGTMLDSITVVLDSGRADGPDTDVDFSAIYSIATQFGGLSLADTVKTAGREGLDTIARDISSTVSADPASLL